MPEALEVPSEGLILCDLRFYGIPIYYPSKLDAKSMFALLLILVHYLDVCVIFVHAMLHSVSDQDQAAPNKENYQTR